MADRRRIVTISPTGTVTTVKDVEDGVSYFAVAGSFQVKPGERRTMMASRARRYGGATAVAEGHDNAEIGWQALVKGTTADLALQNLEDILSVLEQPRTDLFFEWRAEAATNSTFYEVRGPAKWSTEYRWVQFAGSLSLLVTVAIPVAPLARGVAVSQTIASTTMPNVIALGTAIGGDAPALADISLRTSGGASAPVWGMIGWTKRPGTPLASSVAPFGIIEAETGTSLTGWASVADVPANFRGGSELRITTAGAGTASALYAVDPSVMQPDDFSAATIEVEVWARMEIPSAIVSPKVVLSLQPAAGLSFGSEQFSAEYGSAGKALVMPSASLAWRPVKLGTLTMPVETATPLRWNVKVAASWGAGSSGNFGMDYLVMVPARQRALSPTAEPNDGAYPKFIASTSDTTKTIRWDLSGVVGSATANQGRDSGLGGSPLELPPGNVDLVIVLSSVVADDPSSSTASMQVSHTAVSGSVLVTPRYWVARGS